MIWVLHEQLDDLQALDDLLPHLVFAACPYDPLHTHDSDLLLGGHSVPVSRSKTRERTDRLDVSNADHLCAGGKYQGSNHIWQAQQDSLAR